MENHESRLDEVCCIGGSRFSRNLQSTRYAVCEFSTTIKACFGIDISHDTTDTHPQYICCACHKVLLRRMSSGDDFVYCGGGCGPQVEWKGHSRLSCDFCNEFGRGERPSKKKRTSLSESQSTETEVQEEAGNTNVKYIEVNETEVNGIDVDSSQVLLELATPSFRASCELDGDRFVGNVTFAACCICKLVLDQAIESSCCSTMFCVSCIWKWLLGHNHCPACRGEMLAHMLKTPHRFVLSALSSLQLHCDFYQSTLVGCPELFSLQQLQQHVAQCTYSPNSPTPTPKRVVTDSTPIGLSGSSGIRPCLHCHTTKKDFQTPPQGRCDSVPRTLESLSEDLTRYEAGGRVLTRAKNYNNVIRPVLLPIPITNACIPALHLDYLGISVYLYDAMPADSRELDLLLAKEVENFDGLGSDFANLVRMNNNYKVSQAK